jgi:hypothetical protein
MTLTRDKLKLQVKCEPFPSTPEGKPQIAVEATLNDIPVTTWDDLPVDMDALKASSVCAGEYYIWNCTCGIPECAGLKQPIQVTHESETITWRNNPRPIADFGDLVFDKTAYLRTIDVALKEMKLQAKLHRQQGIEVEFLLRSEDEVFWRPEDRVSAPLPIATKMKGKKKGKR